MDPELPEMPDVFVDIQGEATFFVHPSFDPKEFEEFGFRFVVSPHIPPGQVWVLERAGKPLTLNPDLWPPSVDVRRPAGIIREGMN